MSTKPHPLLTIGRVVQTNIETNFQLWQTNIMHFLNHYGMGPLVRGECPRPNPSDPNYEKWKNDEFLAVAFIQFNVSERALAVIGDIAVNDTQSKAHQQMIALTERYGKPDKHLVPSLVHELLGMSNPVNESDHVYGDKLQTCLTRIIAAVPNDSLTTFLNIFGAHLVVYHARHKYPRLYADQVTRPLVTTKSALKALYMQEGQAKIDRLDSKTTTDERVNDVAAMAMRPYRRTMTRKPISKKRMIGNDCPFRRHGCSGHHQSKYDCFFDIKNKHQRTTPWKKRFADYISREERRGPSAHMARVNVAQPTNYNSDEESLCSFMALVETDSLGWVVDSGCSVSITQDFKSLCNPIELNKPILIETANGRAPIKATHKGAVILELGERRVQLNGVLYSPQLPRRTRLLSLNDLHRIGITCSFIPSAEDPTQLECHFQEGEKVIYKISQSANKTFCLYTLPRPMPDKPADKQLAQQLQFYHRLLGHASAKRIRSIMETTLGRKISTQECKVAWKTLPVCDVCMYAKQVRKPFPTQGSRATNVLDLIHTDVCGKLYPASYNRKHYFVTFIDDFSRYTWIYFLASKDEVAKCFEKFRALAQNQIERTIKRVRTDNGGEYIGHEFQSILAHNGIIHETTNPHSPQQNGVAERKNRTLIETARCLLFESGIPLKLWPEAIRHANYLTNVLPSNALDGQTPIQVIFKRTVDLTRLLPFGTTGYAKRTSELQKLDKQSVMVRYLGFEENTKGYRVQITETGQIVKARDVTFTTPDLVAPQRTTNSVWEPDSKDQENAVAPSACGSQNTPVIMAGEELTSKTQNQHDNVKLIDSMNPYKRNTSAEETLSNDELEIETEAIVPADEIHSDSNIKEMSMTRAADDHHVPTVEVNVHDNSSLRRSQRSVRQPERLAFTATKRRKTNVDEIKIPLTLDEALSLPEKIYWQEAIQSEFNSLIKNRTWTEVPQPTGVNIVTTRWVFDIKRNFDGSIQRYKARLVARGFTQQYGIDFHDTYSPVASYDSLRMVLALAAFKNWHIIQADVKTAFLNGKLDEDIYIRPPPGYKSTDGFVLKLSKALYGLKQASRQWYQTLKNAVLRLHYQPINCEESLFVRCKDRETSIIWVYVDDMLFTGDSHTALQNDIKQLRKQFDIPKTQEAKYILGVSIMRDRHTNTIRIRQDRHIEDLLTKFDKLTKYNPYTPMQPVDIGILTTDSSPLTIHPYREVIGSLTHIMNVTRPDIAFALSALSRFCSSPRENHWNELLRIVAYIRTTRRLCLTYGGDKERPELLGYSDSDYASDSSRRTSQLGWIVIFNGGCISWKSHKSNVTAQSSCETELIATAKAANQIKYLRTLLSQLLGCVSIPTTILYCDNKSAIDVAKNENMKSKLKHVDVKTWSIRDKLKEKTIRLEYIGTKDQIADIMTKSLRRILHKKFVNMLNLM